MKLVSYTTKNAPHIKPEKKNVAKAFILFRSTGTIQLNMALTRLLNIQEGAKIAFHQDFHYPSDWYISLTDKPHGFKVTMLKTRGCSIQSNQLVGLIATSLSIGKDSPTPPDHFVSKLTDIQRKTCCMSYGLPL